MAWQVISRRDFLKGAAATGLSVAAATVLGVGELEPTSAPKKDVKDKIDKITNICKPKNKITQQIGYIVADPVINTNNGDITVTMLTSDGEITVKAVDQTAREYLEKTAATAQWKLSAKTFAEIRYGMDGQVENVTKLFTLGTLNVWFSTIKYGVEFMPVNGNPGNCIAVGWVLNKNGNKVTVGDTNKFEETYTLDNKVQVYEINIEKNTIAKSSYTKLPVTKKTNGKYSLTAERQLAVFVFDQNYKNVKKAKATEVYFLSPKNVIEDKYLVDIYDTMGLYSYNPDNLKTDGVIEKPATKPWLTYSPCFNIVPDRMWFVGDTDVGNYLFKTDKGLVMLDTGWPMCAYVYFQNIEEAGFDPREIKYLCLSHGHGDHYGTACEFVRMIENAGKEVTVYETDADAEGYKNYGYPEIAAPLTDKSVINAIDKYYPWGEYMDFGGVRLLPIHTPGHTPGTGSFLFEVTKKDKTKVTFGYMGGFGTIHTPDQGYRRLQFSYYLRYLQQFIEVDYSLPQHCAHFPMLEINKACKQAGIPFLEGMVAGNDGWCNFLERRMACQDVQKYHDRFAADPTIHVTYPDGSVHDFTTQKAAAKLQSTEKAGPWRREAGDYTITLADEGKVLHGFNVLENSNEKFRGCMTSLGMDLGDGVMITRDGYVHDPDDWFVQVAIHVDDDYQGKLDNLTNGINGPIECLTGEDWVELVRCHVGSKEEAEALKATLKKGAKHTVTMNKMCDILCPDGDYTKAFR